MEGVADPSLLGVVRKARKNTFGETSRDLFMAQPFLGHPDPLLPVPVDLQGGYVGLRLFWLRWRANRLDYSPR